MISIPLGLVPGTKKCLIKNLNVKFSTMNRGSATNRECFSDTCLVSLSRSVIRTRGQSCSICVQWCEDRKGDRAWPAHICQSSWSQCVQQVKHTATWNQTNSTGWTCTTCASDSETFKCVLLPALMKNVRKINWRQMNVVHCYDCYDYILWKKCLFFYLCSAFS